MVDIFEGTYIGQEVRLSQRKGHVGIVTALLRDQGLAEITDKRGRIHRVKL